MAIFIYCINNPVLKHVKLSTTPVIFGRGSKSDIKLDEPMASKRHCKIFLDKDHRVMVEDLDSSNGTYINDDLVNSAHLHVEDELRIGETRFAIHDERMTLTEKLSNLRGRAAKAQLIAREEEKINKTSHHRRQKEQELLKLKHKYVPSSVGELSLDTQTVHAKKKVKKRADQNVRPKIQVEVEEKQDNSIFAKIGRLLKSLIGL